MRNKTSCVDGRAKSNGEHMQCKDNAAKWDSSGMLKWLYSYRVDKKFVLEKARV